MAYELKISVVNYVCNTYIYIVKEHNALNSNFKFLLITFYAYNIYSYNILLSQ
jgi:hypothetical protein